jgi:hypothetical protein
VTETPQSADERPGGEAALARDDGGHRHQVIGIGRVLQPEDEPEDRRREQQVQD